MRRGAPYILAQGATAFKPPPPECGCGGLWLTMMSQSGKDLVRSVKEWQRLGEGHKQSWYKYCNSRGSSKYDPSRHDEEFLAQFLQAAEAGEISIQIQPTGGGALAPRARHLPTPRG